MEVGGIGCVTDGKTVQFCQCFLIYFSCCRSFVPELTFKVAMNATSSNDDGGMAGFLERLFIFAKLIL